MRSLLQATGRAFLIAFGAALLVFGPGILAAPDLSRLKLVGVAALLSAIGMAAAAIVAYKPSFSFVTYIGEPFGNWLNSFLYAFLGSLAVTLTGALGAPDLATERALATSAIVGAFSAGLRAVEGALTPGEWPAPAQGVKPPPTKP